MIVLPRFSWFVVVDILFMIPAGAKCRAGKAWCDLGWESLAFSGVGSV